MHLPPIKQNMSMNQGYQQSAAVAAALDSNMESMRDKPAGTLPSHRTGAQATGVNSVAGVPGYYHTDTPGADTTQAYRFAAVGDPAATANLAAMNVFNGQPTQAALENFKVQLTQRDIDFFEKRRQEQLAVEFDDWITKVIDVSDPGQARWLQGVHPELWARRERFVDDRINVESRAAKIRLRGIQSKDDLKFLFAVDRGLIQLPQHPAFSNAGYASGQYRRGVFCLIGTKGNGRTYGFNGRNEVPARAAFAPAEGTGGPAGSPMAGFWSPTAPAAGPP